MVIFEIIGLLALCASTWLNYKLLNKLLIINDNVDTVLSTVETFKEHLEKLNASEVYHGEPTIERLIAHSEEVVEDLENFLSGFSEEEMDAKKEER